jgi:hypothetical protein
VSGYRLLGASSLILYEIVEIKNMNKLIKYMKYLLILDCSRIVYHLSCTMAGGVAGVRCMFDVFFTFSIQLFLGVFEMSS